MVALLLNSGMGTRMGSYTKEIPKTMVKLSENCTIIQNQIELLMKKGISNFVITTGHLDYKLEEHVRTSFKGISVKFVYNPLYETTNYIYSIYLAREHLKDNDIISIHGDLVFGEKVLDMLLNTKGSSVVMSSTEPLPQNDFKLVLKDGLVSKIGIEFFEGAYTMAPLYKVEKNNWLIWLNEIIAFCERNERKCYAENAFNAVSKNISLYPVDVLDLFCREVDTQDDLEIAKKRMIL